MNAAHSILTHSLLILFRFKVYMYTVNCMFLGFSYGLNVRLEAVLARLQLLRIARDRLKLVLEVAFECLITALMLD